MNKELIKKIMYTMAFLIWSAIVLSAFYITQRPLFFQVINGVFATLWAVILTAILLVNSAGIGAYLFKWMRLAITAPEQLILGSGLGLGIFGLLGYGLGAAGLAKPLILLIILFTILVWIFISKLYKELWNNLRSFLISFQEGRNEAPIWLPLAIAITLAVGFIFALLPPAEGFDGLFYHLTLPERLLADKQILPYNILQFWFPSLMEGNYIWALGLGSERTTQLIHWSFSLLMIWVIWEWARAILGNKTAWWSMAVLISMPSLPWLSSWAYTDIALVFYCLASLYSVWKSNNNGNQWVVVSGLFSGMAMGIKYTSFVLPVFCVALILLWGKSFYARIVLASAFSLIAILTASPWYIRNWIVMGNPFYPFAFGGRYWDSFQAAWYAGNGSGIGWNFVEIILLPLNIMLGHRDQNYFDGRIGAFFLLFIPLVIWSLWKNRSTSGSTRRAFFIFGSFALLNYLIWTFGVIQTIYLWQSRLLWPGLIPLVIPIGLGITLLSNFDLPHFRISFVYTVIIGIVIAVTLLDNTLSLVARRPIQYALGIESRQSYFQRMQPRYTSALELVDSTPSDSFVYFMFEPRSYNMSRKVQPDPINNNLAHDYYLYENAEAILNNWKRKGYTHILLYKSPPDKQFSEQFLPILPFLKLEAENEYFKIYSVK